MCRNERTLPERTPAEDQAQTLLVLTPEGPGATERMRLLSVIGSARFGV